ncbi:MAG: hypothetical protein LUD03_07015 [Firmicutes bacterium]|nr:hypothetical protein [Bacillota bacterium]
MANENKQQPGAAEQAKTGFMKGFLSTYNPPKNKLFLTSPAPLQNKMLTIRKFYFAVLAAALIGFFYKPIWAIAFFGLLIVYLIESCMLNRQLGVLRVQKFQFDSSIDTQTVFNEVMPILTGKYNMLVEINNKGTMTITHQQNIMYDFTIGTDDSFTLWWHFSMGKALVNVRKYKPYRQMLASMGIIAYEIQHQFNIQPQGGAAQIQQ